MGGCGLRYDLECYRSVLARIQDAGYCFLKFGDLQGSCNKEILLRHDVDLSPIMAFHMAEAEAELGIHANYFFQLNSETYNGLSTDTAEKIKQIQSLGHCVGLHIDEAMMSVEENVIHRTLEWFSDTITPVDRVVSFHRPSDKVIDRHYKLFISSYSPQFFLGSNYVSDARRNGEFWGKLDGLISSSASPIQWLTHPGWWYAEDDPQKMLQALRDRRMKEFDEYLVYHFRQYFGPHVYGKESSTSGV